MVTRRALPIVLAMLGVGCATVADPAALPQRLRDTRFVLLGEVHDNPAHHALRAEWLRTLLADGRPTWVVFEQIDRGHDAAIAALPAALARDVDALVDAAQLDRRGWAWPLHRPLFEAALAGGARVVGGNLGRADATQIVRGGAARLPADLQRWFDAARPEARWSEPQAAQMRSDIDAGHCHALPDTMLAPMALAQRARDAALATAMLAAPPGTRVVLIAGNGHVRNQLGVPHYLRSAGVAAAQIASVGTLERAAPGDRHGPAGAGDYDAVAVTDPLPRPDPCAAFRRPAEPLPGTG